MRSGIGRVTRGTLIAVVLAGVALFGVYLVAQWVWGRAEADPVALEQVKSLGRIEAEARTEFSEGDDLVERTTC
ncbi:hypothetical protein HNP84_009061 [Thermocatellispora tengchongensis]|uniref:Uncharacterized protein n=1 Tax=Thermocatellispora tengchongensis TaxID=1073253 RepID=A0A840PIC5_9ACTN|nr:hypothetical protein [Thermocatellispora tengchongensis]MBB5139298.1 hypothetical protein [Thermocatellispora tengchongensis]